MPIEKMVMLNAAGQIEKIDDISQEMVKCGCIHVISAVDDIKRHTGLEDIQAIGSYRVSTEYSGVMDMINTLIEITGMEKIVNPVYLDEDTDLKELDKTVRPLYNEASRYGVYLSKAQESLKAAGELRENVENIKDLRFAVSLLKGLKFFKFSMGRIRKGSYSKLVENIENIPSIIYMVHSAKDSNVIISFTPKLMVLEVDEIFRSLGYEEIPIPDRVRGVPEDVLKRFDELINERREEIEVIKAKIENLKNENEELIKRCFTLIMKYRRAQDINSEAACGKRVFYITGWVPVSDAGNLVKKFAPSMESVVDVTEVGDVPEEKLPPSKLINNRFVKPFEYLVNMYGIPSYHEADPTTFVAISYMIMFGAMFGDVGQGFVIFTAGLYLLFAKKSYYFGGILSRVGASSIIFGFLYGSLFGNENILKPILFHPLDNINTVLMGSVVLGIVLSITGYLINFRNSIKMGEIEEGLFGREGGAGFLFYIILILCAVLIFVNGRLPVPAALVGAVLVLLLLLIVLKQPLSRLIEGKRPLHKDRLSDYYTESLFGVVETLLSMLSKTISFIRLGAFALNHAGLFIAFATISNMMHSSIGGALILILGNIIIIGLEGLVVFIQGLRLEYYELFSRFYRGDGMEYNPVSLNDFRKR